MTGGLLSRHTYPEAITPETTAHYGDFVRIAHENGIKVIDHLDATLLWNNDSGFRLIAERIGQTERDRTTGLPNPRLCLANPDFHRIFLDYCKELVRLGVDGFQIDEAHFFGRGCICAECRRQFHADTGWFLPMNELDPVWKDVGTPLAKAWFTWKRARVANWFVETRRELQKLTTDQT